MRHGRKPRWTPSIGRRLFWWAVFVGLCGLTWYHFDFYAMCFAAAVGFVGGVRVGLWTGCSVCERREDGKTPLEKQLHEVMEHSGIGLIIGVDQSLQKRCEDDGPEDDPYSQVGGEA